MLAPLSADESFGQALQELNAVRAKRKENLQAIVALHKQNLTEGTGKMEDLVEAKFQLLLYQREGESSSARKLLFQKEIVELETQRHSLLKARLKSGHGSQLDFLKSKEHFLKAQQTLLKLRVEANLKGPGNKAD